MAEHSDLVNEIAILEKLSTQERLKIAKKRRMQQLKKWSQREKDVLNTTNLNNKIKNNDLNNEVSTTNDNNKKKIERVHFIPSVILLDAAARNDIDEVRRLLVLGVEPDSTNEDGLTALHQCCIDNCEEMMKLLIDFGANVNAKDSEQWTPLHAAATCGYLHLVKYLIEKDADLLAVNSDGNMPYDICDDEETLDYIEQQMASRGITQQQIDETRAQTEMNMLTFLRKNLEEGVDLNTIKFDCGASALHVAAANDYISVVEFLLENNMPTNVNDDDQWQPIHAAACWGHQNVVELLVQFGADLNAKTKNGETPSDICEDIDLRERIIQLKNEMESKQLQQQQLNLNGNSRLKRTHSQNTRSQSVRRTSIREKNQISRREAREEAKIRHHIDDSEISLTNSNNNSIQQITNDAKSLNEKSQSRITMNKNNQSQVQLKVSNSCPIDLNNQNGHLNGIIDREQNDQNDNNKKKFEIDVLDNGISKISINSDKDSKSKDHIEHTENVSNNQNSTQNKNNVLDSLKVEIHVTVNTQNSSNNMNMTNNYHPNNSNINTLSDLKKLRSDLRHRNNFTTEPNDNANTLMNTMNTIDLNGDIHDKYKESNINHTYFKKDILNNRHGAEKGNHVQSSSPNSSLKKFKGNPSDMVGEIQKKKCCSLM